MAKSCERKDYVPGGIHVTVSIVGNDIQNCRWKGKTRINHTVTITSLTLFPLEVTCQGVISSNPRKLKFVTTPAGNKVTDDNWIANTTISAASAHSPLSVRVFDHVILEELAKGTETIGTIVRAKRTGLSTNHKVVVDINLTIE